MNILKNVKIGWKLVSGFGLLLVTIFIVAFLGAYNITVIFNNYSNKYEFPIRRHIHLKDIEVSLMNMRRIVTYAALHSGDLVALEAAEAELNAVHENITTLLDKYKYSIHNDWQLIYNVPDSTKDMFLGQAYTLGDQIDQYIARVALPVLDAARVGNQGVVFDLIQQGININYEINSYFNEISNAVYNHTGSINERVTYITNSTFNLIIILSITVLAVGILVAVLIFLNITRPIKEVAAALSAVEAGNLNINFSSNIQYETGLLAQSTLGLVNTLQTLMYDMDRMADAHDNGQIDTFINTDRFSGVYRDVAEKINYMVVGHIKTQNKVITVVSEIANGDFDAKVDQFPGKKSMLNSAIENMRFHIKDVVAEVEGLIHATSKGQLSVKIDESKYDGGWRKIMAGLNQVTRAVDMPISEINEVMLNLSRGEFNIKVAGEYEGDFLSIRESVNNTIDELASYISEVSQVLEAISRGDLSKSIERRYLGNFVEIKESINDISTTLHKTILEIKEVISEVLARIGQISKSTSDLADGANIQANAMNELTDSISIIKNQTHQNAEGANNADSLSNIAAANAQSGSEAMGHTVEAMAQISLSVHNISAIMRAIQSIASQTNLLSLNASIEAARSGEHGKGFGVVADEVRNLAAKSRKASEETTALIEDSIQRVESGISIALTTAESLNISVEKSKDVSSLVNGISQASREQADAVTQVSSGLAQISEVVKHNSTLSQESAAALQEINAQVELLQQLIAYFKLT